LAVDDSSNDYRGLLILSHLVRFWVATRDLRWQRKAKFQRGVQNNPNRNYL